MMTYKLIFQIGIQEKDVDDLLSKYSKDYIIHNFYPDKQIGCNRIAFAVVEMSQKDADLVSKEKTIKRIEVL